jgi:hypothetical protein
LINIINANSYFENTRQKRLFFYHKNQINPEQGTGKEARGALKVTERKRKRIPHV